MLKLTYLKLVKSHQVNLISADFSQLEPLCASTARLLGLDPYVLYVPFRHLVMIKKGQLSCLCKEGSNCTYNLEKIDLDLDTSKVLA